ncbi:MAG TPA: DUF4340 domain-containing protein, partial [Polyangiaceae bacterium]|nr:DUF4340 domain-containing protein [Polyangiaceae bacterium]
MSERAQRIRHFLRHHGVSSFLVVGAVVLTVLVIVWERGRVTTAEAEDRKYQLFDAWRADDLARIDIELGDRKLSVHAERAADGTKGYRLFEGEQEIDADEQAVGEFLVTLEFAGFERRVEGIDRAELGLGEPRAVVTIDMGKLHYKLVVGGAAPSPEGARYAEVEGGARGTMLYVVRSQLVDELEKGASSLRAKGLIPYLSTELSSITLAGKTASWKLERGPWGGRTAGAFFVNTGDRKLRASRRTLDGWLVKLARLEVERFVELPPSKHARAHVLTLDPEKADEKSAVLELGGDCPGGGALVVRRAPRPAAGCTKAESIESLLVSADELVDRHVIGTADGDITELTISDNDTTIEMARKESSWHMRKPTEGDVEEEAAHALMNELDGLEGEILPSDKAPGLDAPRGRVRILGLPERGGEPGAEERVEEIDVGEPADGYVHVRRRDDGAVLRIAEDAAVVLTPRPALLRSTKVHDASMDDVRGLSLDCDGKVQKLERDQDGGWKLIEPKARGLGGDMGLASALAEELRELTAVRWVSERPLEAHQLSAPWCKIDLQVEQKGEKKNLRLKLGAETQGGYFARSGDGPVFVTAASLGADARRWLFDRSA